MPALADGSVSRPLGTAGWSSAGRPPRRTSPPSRGRRETGHAQAPARSSGRRAPSAAAAWHRERAVRAIRSSLRHPLRGARLAGVRPPQVQGIGGQQHATGRTGAVRTGGTGGTRCGEGVSNHPTNSRGRGIGWPVSVRKKRRVEQTALAHNQQRAVRRGDVGGRADRRGSHPAAGGRRSGPSRPRGGARRSPRGSRGRLRRRRRSRRGCTPRRRVCRAPHRAPWRS